MSFPVQVTFHGIDASDALRAHVVAHAQRLARVADIDSCHVVVAAASRRHRHGNLCDVQVTLVTSGGEQVAAGGRAVQDERHADPYLAVADTFEALRRRLEDRARSSRDSARTTAAGR